MPDSGGLIGMNEKFLGVNARLDKVERFRELDKEQITKNEKKIDKLEQRIEWQDREIKSIMEDIKEIHGDTRWLRRTITGAIIAALSTGLLGGAIGLLWTIV